MIFSKRNSAKKQNNSKGRATKPNRRKRARCIQTLENRRLMAVMDDATTSIRDGDWQDSATWDNGVPTEEIRAIIAQDTTVQLGGRDHVAREIVVHGELSVPEAVYEESSEASDPSQVGDGKLRVYYDGELAGSKPGSQLWSHPGDIAIGGVNALTLTHTGSQQRSADVTFGGKIDDVLNYNRALVADELSELHSIGRGEIHRAPTDGMAAAWKFRNGNLNDSAINDSIDDIGQFVNGEPDTTGYVLKLNGDGEQVDVNASSDLNAGTFVEKTISLWFNVKDTTGRQVIYEQGGEVRGLNIYLEGDTLYVGGWNNDASQSGWEGNWVTINNVTANEWHHVALVLDADAPSPTIPLNGVTKTLSTRWMHINSNGTFQIGSSSDRYDEGQFELTLTGTDVYTDKTVELASGSYVTVPVNDGFLMTHSGGSLQLFGADKLSFTKLSASVSPGANEITVANVIERNFTEGNVVNGEFETSEEDDGKLNWEVGDKIVIASSSHNYRHEDQNTIEAITDNGDGTTTLTLSEPLEYSHYGKIESYSNESRNWEIDMRAEVGLLSRNVVIQGLESQDTDDKFGDRLKVETYDELVPRPDFENGGTKDELVEKVKNGIGGNVMIMEGSDTITVDGVQLNLMGQTGRVGRYPIHWHVAHDRTGDSLRNTSITNSNNRGVTLHGTQNVEIEGVLLHDIHGHGFFFEDGVETGNKLTANIAFGIHRVGRKLSEDNFLQDSISYDIFSVDLHDDLFVKGPRGVLSAAYWVTNPDNEFIGNVTAGSEGMGFWYVGVKKPLGDSALESEYKDVVPFEAPMGRNVYSTVHSTGTGFGLGEPGFMPVHFTEYDPETFEGVIEHLTSYKNHVGTWVETEIDFNEYRAADNHTQFRSFDELEMRNSLIVGDSRGNAEIISLESSDDEGSEPGKFGNYGNYKRHPRQRSVVGIALYQEGINVVDTHFAGFQGDKAYTFNFQGDDGFNRFASTFKRISYEGGDQTGQLKATRALTTANQFFNPVADQNYLYDIDGSLTGIEGATVVFNNPFIRTESEIEIGKNMFLTTDIEFGKVKLSNLKGNSVVDIVSGDGDASQIDRGNDFEHVVVLNDGNIEMSFSSITSRKNGFELDLSVDTDAGTSPSAYGIFILKDLPSDFEVTNVLPSEGELENEERTSYVRRDGAIWLKVFADDGIKVQLGPA